jgi:hypothetical protein
MDCDGRLSTSHGEHHSCEGRVPHCRGALVGSPRRIRYCARRHRSCRGRPRVCAGRLTIYRGRLELWQVLLPMWQRRRRSLPRSTSNLETSPPNLERSPFLSEVSRSEVAAPCSRAHRADRTGMNIRRRWTRRLPVSGVLAAMRVVLVRRCVARLLVTQRLHRIHPRRSESGNVARRQSHRREQHH